MSSIPKTQPPLNRLISAMLNPAFYDHPAPDIEVLETHISHVILAGDFAYKLKKPVNLGFLDFSTLEARRFSCNEELRLNRRLAPDLYLEVVRIGGTPENPVLGGMPAIEYAVRMRRFPQASLLDRVLERGALLPRHVDDLAREIAAFHKATPAADSRASFGSPDSIIRPAQQNFEQIRPRLSDPEDLARLDRLQTWTDRVFEQHRAVFSARKTAGYVRECHGDLHTGNIALIQNKATIFDCIEFSPELRWIDVMSEAAFLVMDLVRRGRPDLGWRFLDGYLQLTGDYQGLEVLRFYFVYRAMVRAKIHAIRLNQAGVPADEKENNLARCRVYLSLAEQTASRWRPLLAITHGPSGSGKTTLSQPMVEQLCAIRVRSDVERKRIFGMGAEEKSGSLPGAGIYGPGAGDETYGRLKQAAATALASGLPVIVDATFLKARWRNEFRRLAAEWKAPFAILDFRAEETVIRQRIVERLREDKDASEADEAVLEKQIASQDPLNDDERACVIPVTTERPGAVTEAIDRLRALMAAG